MLGFTIVCLFIYIFAQMSNIIDEINDEAKVKEKENAESWHLYSIFVIRHLFCLDCNFFLRCCFFLHFGF